MSKIYEALLRAEQDRAAGIQDHPQEVREGHPVADYSLPPVIPAPPATVASGMPAHYAPVSSLEKQVEASVAPAMQIRTALSAADLSGVVSVWHPDTAKLPALESRGSQVEQFRSLRSKLFEFRDLNKLKSLVVSSALPAEGKSFVATNLAITFARHKSARVLLIDCDLRRSSQHKALGSPSGPGLAEYLSGKVALKDIIRRGTADEEGTPLPTGLSTLSFVPAGEAGDRAADLSGSARFAELMKLASAHYDWVIVDSSPVNLVTDAVNFARSCDGVLLIARAGVTKYEAAQRALAELKSTKVIGMVLNAVENPPTADGYYGYDTYDRLNA